MFKDPGPTFADPEHLRDLRETQSQGPQDDRHDLRLGKLNELRPDPLEEFPLRGSLLGGHLSVRAVERPGIGLVRHRRHEYQESRVLPRGPEVYVGRSVGQIGCPILHVARRPGLPPLPEEVPDRRVQAVVGPVLRQVLRHPKDPVRLLVILPDASLPKVETFPDNLAPGQLQFAVHNRSPDIKSVSPS